MQNESTVVLTQKTEREGGKKQHVKWHDLLYGSIIRLIVSAGLLYKKNSDIVVTGWDEKLNYLRQQAVVV